MNFWLGLVKYYEMTSLRTFNYISELINATNPTGKVLEVIPVMRSDAASLAYHDSLVEAAPAVKGIRLATPVMYDPSEYPKSDAFQV